MKGQPALLKKDGIPARYWKHRAVMLLLLPGLVYYIIFCYGPMYGIQIAFRNFNIRLGISGSPWVGLKHFRTVFSTPSFREVFFNTVTISFYKLLFGFPAPVIFALLLSELKGVYFKKTVQTLSYLPHFVSWVVLSGIFIQLLSPGSGPVNGLLKALGLPSIYFLGDTRFFRLTLVLTSIWKGVGWGSIVYLAAITSVDRELYEAAALDGANRFQMMTRITLPSITHVIVFMFIMAVGGLVGDDFDQIFNLYNAAVYRVGDVISTYTYRRGLQGLEYGFGAAVGLFQSVISFMLILIANKLASKFSDYALW
jgi:putative aldouronate transport system permease protein